MCLSLWLLRECQVMRKLLLLLLLSVAAVAPAQEYGNPYAYVTNDKGGALVLTDKEDKTICPPKARLVVSVNSREETEPTLGCWVQMRNETTGQVEVLIIWHPSHNIQWIPLNKFKSLVEDCPELIYL